MLRASREEADATSRRSAFTLDGSDTDSSVRLSEELFDEFPEGVLTDQELVLPDSVPPLDQDLANPANPYSITHDSFQTPRTQRDVDIWNGVHEFFNTVYINFPIVSYADVAARLIGTPDWFAVPDLRTLLLSLRLVNATAVYRIDAQNENHLRNLIHQVETSRLSHDFADSATLDAVVCFLFLFTAYNVLEKHGRAFLYLGEAFSLLEAVSPSNEKEEL